MEKITKKPVFRPNGLLAPPNFPPPDEDQKVVITAMIDTIAAGENGLVVWPQGTGKSVMAAYTARVGILSKRMKGLYLYQENEGLSQARNRFESIFGDNNVQCANFFGQEKDHLLDNADMIFAGFQALNNQYEKWYQIFDPDHFDFIIVNEGHHSQAPTHKEVIDYFTCPYMEV